MHSDDESREQSPIRDATADAAAAAAAVVAEKPVQEVDNRKQPWRALPEFESVKDDVTIKKVKDMRLFGNHVNAHS